MISAIGVSYLLQNLATYLFTALPRAYPEIPFLKKIFQLGSVSASLVTFLTPVLTLLMVFGLLWLLNHTKLGMVGRFASEFAIFTRCRHIARKQAIFHKQLLYQQSFFNWQNSFLYYSNSKKCRKGLGMRCGGGSRVILCFGWANFGSQGDKKTKPRRKCCEKGQNCFLFSVKKNLSVRMQENVL